MQLNDQTLYEILEVDKSATQEEIIKAFQRAKATYSVSSPALYSVFSRNEAEELLKLINEAYTILSNQATRRTYDQTLVDKVHATEQLRSMSDAGSALPQVPAVEENFAIPQATSMPWESTTSDYAEPTMAAPKEAIGASIKEEVFVSKMEVRQVDVAVSAKNQGAGRTRFSTYEVDPVLEEEIKNQGVFDGTFLQKIRVYKRLSLEQISEFSRIGRHYLIAVENNDFISLPAPVFVRGFLVQIAKILGLDERRAVESYMRLYKQSREKR